LARSESVRHARRFRSAQSCAPGSRAAMGSMSRRLSSTNLGNHHFNFTDVEDFWSGPWNGNCRDRPAPPRDSARYAGLKTDREASEGLQHTHRTDSMKNLIVSARRAYNLPQRECGNLHRGFGGFPGDMGAGPVRRFGRFPAWPAFRLRRPARRRALPRSPALDSGPRSRQGDSRRLQGLPRWCQYHRLGRPRPSCITSPTGLTDRTLTHGISQSLHGVCPSRCQRRR